MFRPDPNGEHSVEEIIAKLSDTLADIPPDNPRAQKLAELIRGLQESRREQSAAKAGSRKR
jgi:predicted ATP-grasp superfamily ATP-dependent carboligase